MKCAVFVVILFTVTWAAKTDKNLCNRPCPTINAPVCGSNGITYGNKCVFERASCRDAKGLEIAHEGACRVKREAEEESDCATFCASINSPVCGSDGVTYFNECLFDSANCAGDKIIAYEGECKNPSLDCITMCPMEYKPVCGSNGKSYANDCFFKIEKCTSGQDWTIAYQGECKKVCTVICTMDYKPVCGSNGKTYSNNCVFESEKCTSGQGWTIAYQGECKKVCTVICTMDYKPVCGSNGKTYSNNCLFESEKCTSGQGWTIAYQGECKNICDRICTMDYKPVCGSNGKTYSNNCVFEREKCTAGTDWTISYEGECKKEVITTAVTKLTETSNTLDKLKLLMLMNFLGNMKKDVTKPSCLRFCIRIYIPVCGSNGVTYTNACVFNNAKCRTGKEWEIAYRGACRPE